MSASELLREFFMDPVPMSPPLDAMPPSPPPAPPVAKGDKKRRGPVLVPLTMPRLHGTPTQVLTTPPPSAASLRNMMLEAETMNTALDQDKLELTLTAEVIEAPQALVAPVPKKKSKVLEGKVTKPRINSNMAKVAKLKSNGKLGTIIGPQDPKPMKSSAPTGVTKLKCQRKLVAKPRPQAAKAEELAKSWLDIGKPWPAKVNPGSVVWTTDPKEKDPLNAPHGWITCDDGIYYPSEPWPFSPIAWPASKPINNNNSTEQAKKGDNDKPQVTTTDKEKAVLHASNETPVAPANKKARKDPSSASACTNKAVTHAKKACPKRKTTAVPQTTAAKLRRLPRVACKPCKAKDPASDSDSDSSSDSDSDSDSDDDDICHAPMVAIYIYHK
jgi:hypothetical protein